MKRIIIVVLLIVISVVAGFAWYLVKSEKMIYRAPALVHEKAIVTFVVGDVTVKKNGAEEWQHVIVGQSVEPGDELQTGTSALADIRFHSSMAVRITENSHLVMDANSIKKMELNLQSGSLYGKFHKLYDEHALVIKTVTSIAAVRGTDLGFEIGKSPYVFEENGEETTDNASEETKKESGKSDEERHEKVTDDSTLLPSTYVYALTGITEVHNPEYNDQKVLLSYQRKINVVQGKGAGDTEEISDADMDRIRKILNSIHFEEVLLISDKILFESGSSKILESSYEELDKIVAVLNEKKVSVRIDGHTDNIGSDSKNQQLSLDRAESIRTYLVEKGIDPERLSAAGFGASQPVTDNSTKAGRAQNRRVEFIVVEQNSSKGLFWWL